MRKSLLKIRLGSIDAIIMDKNWTYEILVVNDGSADKSLRKQRNMLEKTGMSE